MQITLNRLLCSNDDGRDSIGKKRKEVNLHAVLTFGRYKRVTVAMRLNQIHRPPTAYLTVIPVSSTTVTGSATSASTTTVYNTTYN